MPVHARQRGAALLVSLMMLLLLTVLAVSAVNMTNLGMKSAANMQDQQLAEAAVQAVIDNKLSGGPSYFRATTAPAPVVRDGYTVQLTKPVCLGFVTAPGYEERYGEEINRFNNAWRVDAEITTSGSVAGETVAISQGVVLKAELAPCSN